MTKTLLLIFCLAAVLGCSPQEKNGADTSAPLAADTLDNPRRADTVKGGKDEIEKSEQIPATTAPPDDWRALIKEYREILCRQHAGVSTTTDKVRLAELNSELNVAQQNLPVSEQPEFVAAKAKAVELESCP